MAVLNLRVLLTTNLHLTFPFSGSGVVTYQTDVTILLAILQLFFAKARTCYHIEILPAALCIEQVNVAVIVDLYLESTRFEFRTSYSQAFLTSFIIYRVCIDECWVG
jgi:hypothetical protein